MATVLRHHGKTGNRGPGQRPRMRRCSEHWLFIHLRTLIVTGSAGVQLLTHSRVKLTSR